MNRRDFLKAVGVGAMAAGLPGCLLAERKDAEAKADRPNIIIILADDMGFSDIGCYGGEIDTPNLDALSAGGLRFRQFYNTARCCPTRASLLTGLYSHKAGIGHMTDNYGQDGYIGYLNDRCVTIAEALGPAGYTGYAVGKWHVGADPEHWPCKRGFSRFYGANSATGHYFGLQKGRRFIIDDTEQIPQTELRKVGEVEYYPFKNADGSQWYATDAFTDYAVKYINEHFETKRNPFFMYLAYTSPHWPMHAFEEDIAKYEKVYTMGWDELRRRRHERMIRMGVVSGDWALTPRDSEVQAWDDVDADKKKDMVRRMAVYAAMIDRMDRNIGRVVEALKKNNVLDNTLVMFLADNGGCAEGGPWGFSRNDERPGTPDSYTSYGKGWANASNTPFRLYKHWVHEGGISTPLIAHWPDVIRQKGKLTDEPGHVVDLMATCCDVGGATYPETYKGKAIATLDGESLAHVFRTGQREGHDAIYWEHEGNRAVRRGEWKLVSRFPGKWELYNLKADRSELHNLSAEHPELVEELSRMYRSWAARSNVEPWGQLRKKPGGKNAKKTGNTTTSGNVK